MFELINSAPGLPSAPSGGSTGSVTLGELTSRPELFDPAELQKEILDANDLRGDIDADKKRIDELKKQLEAAFQATGNATNTVNCEPRLTVGFL